MNKESLYLGNSIVKEIEKYKNIKRVVSDRYSHFGIRSDYGNYDKDNAFIPDDIKQQIISQCNRCIEELEVKLEEL